MTEGPDLVNPPPRSLRESAVEFLSARLELVSLEARDAGRLAARRGVLIAFIAGCAMTAWLAGIAGLIGGIAASRNGIPWHLAALGVAVLHLLIAGIAAMVLRRPSPPAFPHARAELAKDREWLLNLKDQPKR